MVQRQENNSNINDTLHINEKLKEYEYLVANTIRKMNITIPAGHNKDDLHSYGLSGLEKAIKTYDVKRGTFLMYAKCKIYNEIIDGIRAFSVVPRSVLDKKKKLQKAHLALENKLNRCPTKEEVMEYLGVDENKYKKYVDSCNYGIDFSLNDVFQTSADEIEEYFAAKKESIIDLIEADELRMNLIKTIDGLNEKAKQVIFLYYYKNLTYKEIAILLQISESTVGEIHNRSLMYLKTKLRKEEIV